MGGLRTDTVSAHKNSRKEVPLQHYNKENFELRNQFCPLDFRGVGPSYRGSDSGLWGRRVLCL